MKMTIGQKLGAGFGVLLAMFIMVGVIVYILNARVLQEATGVNHNDVPGAILSLSLLDEIGDMNANLLEYLTGEAEEQEYFEEKRQEFMTFFKELEQLETESQEIQVMQKIENLFLDYAQTAEQEIFKRYDPEREQWARKQAEVIEQEYGTVLEQLLNQSSKAVLQNIRLTTDRKEIIEDNLPSLHLYLALASKTGDLARNLIEYVTGKIDKQKAFFQMRLSLKHLSIN